MPLHSIARAWEFPEDERSDLTFSDDTKIRLVPDKGRIELKKDADGDFPIGADIFIRGQLFNPLAVRKWLGFFANPTLPVDVDLVAVTNVRYRFNDGTDDLFFDTGGGAWVVAGAGDWNTLVEVQANIATFPVTSRKIRPVFELSTTDTALTPSISRAVIGLDVDIPSFDEEFIYRTFIRSLKDNVRPVADDQVNWPGGSVVDITVFETTREDPFEVVDVDGAFDVVADPNLTNNLVSSYVAATNTLTLTQSVNPGEANVRLRFVVKPTVAVMTHSDFVQISSVPSIIIRSVEQSFLREGVETEVITNVTDATAQIFPVPRQVNYEMPIDIRASRSTLVVRTTEALLRYVRNNPVIRSPNLDSKVRLDVLDEAGFFPRPDEDNVQRSTIRIGMMSAEKWIRDARSGFGILDVKTNFSPV